MADSLEEYMNIFALRITHLGGLASVTVRVAALYVEVVQVLEQRSRSLQAHLQR